MAGRRLAILATLSCILASSIPVARTAAAARKELRHPFKASLVPGSQAVLDLGDGVQRSVPLIGFARGYAIGRVGYIDRIRARITSLDVRMVKTDLIVDETCNGVPSLALGVNAASRVLLDRRRPSTAVVNANTAGVVSTSYVRLRGVVDLRNPADCTLPPVVTGYTEAFYRVVLRGEVASTTELASRPQRVELRFCTVEGDPAKPCAGPERSVPATLRIAVKVEVDFL